MTTMHKRIDLHAAQILFAVLVYGGGAAYLAGMVGQGHISVWWLLLAGIAGGYALDCAGELGSYLLGRVQQTQFPVVAVVGAAEHIRHVCDASSTLTMAGYLVLRAELFTPPPDEIDEPGLLLALARDRVHLADVVLVVAPDGQISRDMRVQIDEARRAGRRIRFYDPAAFDYLPLGGLRGRKWGRKTDREFLAELPPAERCPDELTRV